ncbi:MAG: BREX system P-loop protein BrxC [Treponema sp.]
MTIKEIFAKPIDRDIQGVIKVGQNDTANAFQELDEYVVTRELSKHFRDFFSSYKNGIIGRTDKMGVWVSGFFGSGKSHFLKILSYLLNNKEVNGKHAVDYFTDGRKIDDAMVIGDIRLAGSVPTDVILFNIDAKSEADSKKHDDAIISVFMKVFNDMQGYCGSIPYVAELERKLDLDGKYDVFKNAFKAKTGKEWESERESFYFISDNIQSCLTDTGIMSADAAKLWLDTAEKNYTISIERFGKLVQDYCERKGSNHHVVFLVDEIGQFIAKDTKLMLNMQTVTEELGTACGGKAWIVVTSQEDIDSLFHVEGNDFSKIQGRFTTRLSLSSANVDEVIRKRILEKTPEAEKRLEALYEQKEAIIKNVITFSDEAEKKLYANAADFAEVYPFIPYQFQLLGLVLTAIRTHGASGKHLAEGERSMLALFKESAMKYEDRLDSEYILVPFWCFYDALEKFIDHTYSNVISGAQTNKLLEVFDVELLKVLFMIKYVKEIKGTVENITTLMIDAIDEDRVELRKKVEESLQRLIRQTLIQKNGEVYIFLTDEEQDINRAINAEVVDPGEVIAQTAQIIFNEILTENKYRYSTRYNFPFNQRVDSYYKVQNEPLGIQIITPYYSTSVHDADGMRQLSLAGSDAVVMLPDDDTFLTEIREALKINKYFTKNAGELNGQFEPIRRAKQDELAEKKVRIHTYIEKAVEDAAIYINGDIVTSNAKGAAARLEEALHKEVESIYHKLYYMETGPVVSTIEALFQRGNELSLDDTGAANHLALADMYNFVNDNALHSNRITLKSVLNQFNAPPYGFTDIDIEWIVGALFKQGKIALLLNSKNISLLECSSSEIVSYITKREYQDKLIIEKKMHASEKQLKAVREILRDIFDIPTLPEDDEEVAHLLKTKADKKLDDIKKILNEYQYQPKFPGKKIMENGLHLMEQLEAHTNFIQLYEFADQKHDDFLDFADDSQNVFTFFAGEQRNIYVRSLELESLYESSKNYIADEELDSSIQIIEKILSQERPWSSIQILGTTNATFERQYTRLLEIEKAQQEPVVQADCRQVQAVLNQKKIPDTFGVQPAFDELLNKLHRLHDIAGVKAISTESSAVKARLINSILAGSEQSAATGVKSSVRTVDLRTVVSRPTIEIRTDADADALAREIAAGLKAQLKNSAGGIILLV